MSILKIARLGNPILREIAKPISMEELKSKEIQKLIDDLLETVKDASGAGLAAPQVHVSKRILVLRIFEEFEVWVNPEIEILSEDLQLTFEGCLSIPDLRGAVARYSKIKVSAKNRFGEDIVHQLENYKAVVAQHEFDHLNGVLFIDKIEPGTLSFLEEYRRFRDEILDYAFSEENMD
ncbi:MAG: peptide deformylase [Proteobacteria bacterium]|nr:peptide deformylase [Pseudomonadota bacterium]|tara:strand:+ start:287 stop:820 length:534 start_codon:yes stop_codon:yes gene_type:complete